MRKLPDLTVQFQPEEVRQLCDMLHDGAASDNNASAKFYLLLQDFLDELEYPSTAESNE